MWGLLTDRTVGPLPTHSVVFSSSPHPHPSLSGLIRKVFPPSPCLSPCSLTSLQQLTQQGPLPCSSIAIPPSPSSGSYPISVSVSLSLLPPPYLIQWVPPSPTTHPEGGPSLLPQTRPPGLVSARAVVHLINLPRGSPSPPHPAGLHLSPSHPTQQGLPFPTLQAGPSPSLLTPQDPSQRNPPSSSPLPLPTPSPSLSAHRGGSASRRVSSCGPTRGLRLRGAAGCPPGGAWSV